MFTEINSILSGWDPLDTWIVVTAALSAMACALPGNYLLLRRQSMMGDALSHVALPGIVMAFLFTQWVSHETNHVTGHASMFLGAMILGVFTALLTEWVHKLGRVEAGAALGVVFTSLFAFGLILLRAAADDVHIDPDCVLYGTIETVVMQTVGNTGIPRAALTNGLVLAVNGFLVLLFYKELRVSTFDPGLATSMGISARLIHYVLMAVTAATLVAAFESVGSILVIAMLIVPPATAHLLTDRMSSMIGISLAVAALSALLGHALALTLPPIIFSRLGYDTITGASTAGMMAVASGLLFVSALLFGPRHGIVSRVLHRIRLSIRIAAEDILGLLYRHEEQQPNKAAKPGLHLEREFSGVSRFLSELALLVLRCRRKITREEGAYRLTKNGRDDAEALVRSHRLWESYMSKHFEVPDDHLHETAARIEHYLDSNLQVELADELDEPAQDPHGRAIPRDSSRQR